jgi:NAD-dependent SIR2 family protein deacetylase
MSERLSEFIAGHERLVVLTGAGISTASGIPDYRDVDGAWKHQKPMDYRDFVSSRSSRQRYWSRSYYGWQRFSEAQPNRAHLALARLEAMGRLRLTITQNVDGLHQRAGSQLVTELHGSLSGVVCLDCGASLSRASMQRELLRHNPELASVSGSLAPDGDAQLQGIDVGQLGVPDCDACGGILKPAVVFFGESVPAARVQQCRDAIADCDALLVVGSSLMVYSGFRFVREAAQQGIPVVAVNRGITRADDLLQEKVELDCVIALEAALRRLDPALAESA